MERADRAIALCISLKGYSLSRGRERARVRAFAKTTETRHVK